jgi:hypothetical protein
MEQSKVCDRCKLPKYDFPKHKNRPDGLSNWCRECRREYDKERYRINRDALLGQRLAYAKTERGKETRNQWARHNKRRLRLDAIQKLGGKCSNMNCRWLNDDGTLGCKDTEVLQIDHKEGGGHKERQEIKSPSTYYRLIIADTTGKYQLLCANCNWKKRYESGELFRI